MTRLSDEMLNRQQAETRTPAELESLQRYEERITKFQKLFASPDFTEYLKLEEEMNDPRIVIAHKCSDPTCEALKAKIRDFWNRQRVLAKVKGSHGLRPDQQSVHPSR